MNEPKKPFVLTHEQRNSKLWLDLMDYFDERLTNKRILNDAHSDEIETARRRGAIAELKEIMRLNKEPTETD
jgi:hypothetical protein